MEFLNNILQTVLESIPHLYISIMRFVFPLLGFLIFLHCLRCLFVKKEEYPVLGALVFDKNTRYPITSYETTIGRGKSCDIIFPLAYISRQHAVLTLTDKGEWRICDTGSQGGVIVNGQKHQGAVTIQMGDIIDLAGVKLRLDYASPEDNKNVEKPDKKRRFRLKTLEKPGSLNRALLYLNVFQILALIQFLFHTDLDNMIPLIGSFVFIAIIPWAYYAFARKLVNKNPAPEIMAFFLTTIGICIAASAAPDSLFKQCAAIILGLVLFCMITWVMKNLKLVMKLRPYIAVLAILFLVVNLLIGQIRNGARNWIDLGVITIQPSEFVKVAFIFASAATLEWLLTTKNLIMLIAFASACIGLLFLMDDFGTALIFFVTFIIIAFMSSGDFRAIGIICSAAGLGALMLVTFRPYIIRRFSAWRHVWEFVNENGYQQTRTLMAIASGGLFGLGGGNGFLSDVVAADTDLAFGIVWEEWGLLIGLMVVGCYIAFLYSSISCAGKTRSSYYSIAACAAAGLFIFQASLNIFGSTDILPLTGVTLPFISNGGSSMASSWGLLGFISAAVNNCMPKKAQMESLLFSSSSKGKKKRKKQKGLAL